MGTWGFCIKYSDKRKNANDETVRNASFCKKKLNVRYRNVGTK